MKSLFLTAALLTSMSSFATTFEQSVQCLSSNEKVKIEVFLAVENDEVLTSVGAPMKLKLPSGEIVHAELESFLKTNYTAKFKIISHSGETLVGSETADKVSYTYSAKGKKTKLTCSNSPLVLMNY